MTLRTLLAGTLLAAAFSQPTAGAVSVYTGSGIANHLIAVADDRDGNDVSDTDYFTDFGSGTVDATDVSNHANANWQAAANGDSATYRVDNVDLSRGVAGNLNYATAYGYFLFTVTKPDTSYSVSGLMEVVGPGTAYARWNLTDLGPSGGHLYFENENTTTANATLAPDGTANGNLVGSHSGIMGPGDYLFYFEYAIQDVNTDGQVATVDNAWAQLDLGDGAPVVNNNDASVPEPTSFVLWCGLGAMGLVAARRRRKQAAF